MMSIYERTKEIGIIKVLGCNMKNIRTMFLMEAGFIGLIGGFLGNLLSMLISKIINLSLIHILTSLEIVVGSLHRYLAISLKERP